jgi:CheY-like chemotaxis protein
MAKILIIDDEKGVCEEFSEILRDENHEVDTALNGIEGLEKIRLDAADSSTVMCRMSAILRLL